MRKKKNLLPDDILLPQLNRNRKRNRIKKRVRKFSRVIVLVIVTVLCVVMFSNAGGNIILGIAQRDLKDNYNLTLTAEKITGNPIKGYTVHGFTITDDSGHEVMRGETFNQSVNFRKLFAGHIRPSSFSMRSVSIDFGSYGCEFFVNEFSANMNNYYANIDAELNGIPIRGSIDFSGIMGIDRAALSFGTGKLLATGGISGGTIDFHVSGESMELWELYTLLPNDLHGRSNFTGTDTNTVTLHDVSGKANSYDNTDSHNRNTVISHDVSGGTDSYGNTDTVTITGGHDRNTATLHDVSGRTDYSGNTDSHNRNTATLHDVSGRTNSYSNTDTATPRNISGRVNFTADITGTTDAPKVSWTFDTTNAKIYGFPVERASANVNYSDGRLYVNDIQASALNVPLQGEITILYGKDEKPSMIAKLEGTEATLDGLDKLLGIPELRNLKGRIAALSVNLNGYIDTLSGLMNMTAPRISYDGRTITDIRAQLKLLGNNRASVDGKFTFEGAPGYLQGTITPESLDVTANVDGLVFERVEYMIESADTFRDAKKVSAVLTVKGRMDSPDISASFKKGGL